VDELRPCSPTPIAPAFRSAGKRKQQYRALSPSIWDVSAHCCNSPAALSIRGSASICRQLVVKFAKQRREAGVESRESTLDASRLRLRPILMTSFAFILGVLPLVVATGAGAEMRRALGVVVFVGMLGATLFGIFLTPVFFYVLQWIRGNRATAERASGAG
jgi:Cu/Ag efflux pump CusA